MNFALPSNPSPSFEPSKSQHVEVETADKSHPPVFKDDPQLEEVMRDYCKEICNIDIDNDFGKVTSYISTGKRISELLADLNSGDRETQLAARDELEILSGKKAKPRDKEELRTEAKQGNEEEKAAKTARNSATSLMWWLVTEAVKEGKPFASGAIRVDDQNKLLHQFLKDCGESDVKNPVYERWSTHMKELSTKDSSQWGYDLPGEILPAQKHTILFGHLDDGTTYIKIEKYGYPPITNGIFSGGGIVNLFRNTAERLGHLKEYVRTRFIKGSSAKTYRKEHVPKAIANLYKLALQTHIPDTRSWFERLYKKSEADKLYKTGIKYGLTTSVNREHNFVEIPSGTGPGILEIVQTRIRANGIKSENNEDYVNQLENKIVKKVEKARSKGYTGMIKGREVVLPFFSAKTNKTA